MTILNQNLDNQKIKSVEGSMDFESLYTSGVGYEKFLLGLKDGKILASVLPTSNQMVLPARLYDERTFTRLEKTAPVTTPGVLQSYTTLFKNLDGQPLDSPITVGLIGFKGVEGHLVHYVHPNGKKLTIGATVKPKFLPQDQRTGSILDIQWFELV
ncbi:MAG: hypothetical protein A3B70_00750 [Deltaproteobacteria bacterium RIFCSPHIGHO2_02_FULL_40_11]|nr:MAG: hypothetical protein A3B70_00750 [Deltaproteobacteria bacterium RIFCSPHIGHO2_02_FULL_40_11]